MSHLPSIGALLLALSFTAAAAPHPSLPPPVVPDCLGVNIHFTEPQACELEMLAAAGFKWVRMDFGWAATERAKGEYDFATYDRLVAKLDENKLRAVFILDYGNPLYAAPGDAHPFTSRAGTLEFRDAFARWAVAAVTHFKGRGYLWELWNEPNNAGFWKPKANDAEYAALAKSTGEALRKKGLLGAKGEAFIGPATSTIDLPFIEECFKAGLLDYWDAVSVHPYRGTAPETVEEEYRSLRLLIRKYAPASREIPIISGEWGYSTRYSAFKDKPPAERDELQAKWLARMFLTNMANDVALSIWYDWRDDGADPNETEHHFGVVGHEYHAGREPVFDPKPAYTAMKTLTEQLGGFRYNKDVTEVFDGILDNPVLLFTRGADLRLAMWRGGGGDERVVTTASPGSFLVTDEMGGSHIVEVTDDEFNDIAREEVQYVVPEKPNRLLQLAAAWKRLPLEFASRAPATISYVDELRNPLPSWVELPGWDEPDKMASAAQPFWVPALRSREEIAQTMVRTSKEVGVRSLASSGKINREVAFRLQRMDVTDVQSLRLDIADAKTIATFYQHSRRRPPNTLELELAPSKDDVVLVLATNRAGDPISGKLTFSFFGGDYGEDIASGALKFARGERQKVVALRLLSKRESGNFFQLEESIGGSRSIDSRGFSKNQLHRLPELEPKFLELGVDGDSTVKAEYRLEGGIPKADPCPSGAPAIHIHYRMDIGWKFLQLSDPRRPIPKDSEAVGNLEIRMADSPAFGLWIHGDGKGLQARIRFKDATGQVFQPDGPRIDWTGWRYVTFPMRTTEEKPLAHWGGTNDGVITYPIKWEAIFILDNVERKPVEGEIYLSAPTLIY